MFTSASDLLDETKQEEGTDLQEQVSNYFPRMANGRLGMKNQWKNLLKIFENEVLILGTLCWEKKSLKCPISCCNEAY